MFFFGLSLNGEITELITFPGNPMIATIEFQLFITEFNLAASCSTKLLWFNISLTELSVDKIMSLLRNLEKSIKVF